MAETCRERRLRQVEELLRQLRDVMKDFEEEQRQLRQQLGLPEGENPCPQHS